jgi:hypothetical protein
LAGGIECNMIKTPEYIALVGGDDPGLFNAPALSDEEKVRLFVDFLVERFKERGWGGRAYDRPAEIAGREPEGGSRGSADDSFRRVALGTAGMLRIRHAAARPECTHARFANRHGTDCGTILPTTEISHGQPEA